MSLALALLIIVVAGALAAATSHLIHRHVHVDVRRRHHEVGTAVFLQLGVIFAVLLAFVFSEVWSEYNDAANAVEMEAKNLVGAAILASALPPAEGRPVLVAERSYLDGVIQHEWRRMRTHRAEAEAVSLRLAEVVRRVARIRPDNAADLGTRAQLLSFVEHAQLERYTRLFQLTSGVPAFLWCLLIAFGVVLAVFVALAGVESGGALISFAVTFATAVAAILVLIHLLDYPFEGALALSPHPFILALERINGLMAGGA